MNKQISDTFSRKSEKKGMGIILLVCMQNFPKISYFVPSTYILNGWYQVKNLIRWASANPCSILFILSWDSALITLLSCIFLEKRAICLVYATAFSMLSINKNFLGSQSCEKNLSWLNKASKTNLVVWFCLYYFKNT